MPVLDVTTYPNLASARGNIGDIIAYVLRTMTSDVPADLACACCYHTDVETFDRIVHYAPGGDSGTSRHDGFYHLLRQRLEALPADAPPQLMSASDLAGSDFESALIFPLGLSEYYLGLVALFARQPQAFTADDAARLAVPVTIVRTVLENFYLHDVLAHTMRVARAIRYMSQAVTDAPSPQHIVEMMHDHLFDAHVTGCALMLYGPVSEDRPNGPFDYLEMRGSWSRRRGSGIALGTRLYVHDYPALLARLERGETVAINDIRSADIRFDPFARTLLRAEGVVSLLLLPVHTRERQLGMILIATNRSHEFAPLEVQTYQTVSEFLAVSTFAQMLLQQHDLVQQGRAALLDAVTDGVVMVLPDAAGARVLTINQRFTSLFGLPEQEAQGLLLPDLLRRLKIPEVVRRDLGARLLSVPVRDPLIQEGEFDMVHAAGYPLAIKWYSAPVYQNERAMGRIYIFSDISAAREAVRLRSSFLSQVSHELRTPLTSIHGFAQLILETTGSQLPPLAREYTEIILSSAAHLRGMFTDMIEVTRAEAGELRLELHQAHLPDVIIETVARLEVESRRRGQQVVMDLDDTLPPVRIDTGRIIQVITNLVTNAIKYSPEGSQIRVRACCVSSAADLPLSAPADVTLPGVLVTVDDQGQGLTWADTRQVFLPFFRTQGARAKKIEGTGLGLTVARSIIEVHRGSIWAEPASREHPGGHFLFLLPAD
jgi:signal transduction histidine kinase